MTKETAMNDDTLTTTLRKLQGCKEHMDALDAELLEELRLFTNNGCNLDRLNERQRDSIEYLADEYLPKEGA